eukprot:GHVT01046010.1.p1 GENE.GHVT01046010.1~~GHVT01046010.1.p1  ORF type:complete len:915 (+),score=188.13 GHVT01046010.1:2018-4762(+)
MAGRRRLRSNPSVEAVRASLVTSKGSGLRGCSKPAGLVSTVGAYRHCCFTVAAEFSAEWTCPYLLTESGATAGHSARATKGAEWLLVVPNCEVKFDGAASDAPVAGNGMASKTEAVSGRSVGRFPAASKRALISCQRHCGEPVVAGSRALRRQLPHAGVTDGRTPRGCRRAAVRKTPAIGKKIIGYASLWSFCKKRLRAKASAQVAALASSDSRVDIKGLLTRCNKLEPCLGAVKTPALAERSCACGARLPRGSRRHQAVAPVCGPSGRVSIDASYASVAGSCSSKFASVSPVFSWLNSCGHSPEASPELCAGLDGSWVPPTSHSSVSCYSPSGAAWSDCGECEGVALIEARGASPCYATTAVEVSGGYSSPAALPSGKRGHAAAHCLDALRLPPLAHQRLFSPSGEAITPCNSSGHRLVVKEDVQALRTCPLVVSPPNLVDRPADQPASRDVTVKKAPVLVTPPAPSYNAKAAVRSPSLPAGNLLLPPPITAAFSPKRRPTRAADPHVGPEDKTAAPRRMSAPLLLLPQLPPRGSHLNFEPYGYKHLRVLAQGQFGCAHLVQSLEADTHTEAEEAADKHLSRSIEWSDRVAAPELQAHGPLADRGDQSLRNQADVDGVPSKLEKDQGLGLFVVKVIDTSAMSTEELEHAEREAEFLRRCSAHPSVVDFVDSFRIPNFSGSSAIVMEYCEGGDLFNRLRDLQQKGKALSEEELLRWIYQVADGLHYMHAQHNLMHCDVKTSNIFIDRNNALKLGDLGIARQLTNGGYLCASECPRGTPLYVSPEMHAGESLTVSSDVWSLGCVVVEMCSIHPAMGAINPLKLLQEMRTRPDETKDKLRAALLRAYSPFVANMATALLAIDPAERPCLKELLNQLQDAIRDASLGKKEETICHASSATSTSPSASASSSFTSSPS